MLLQQLRQGKLEAPFTAKPPSGPLPMLPAWSVAKAMSAGVYQRNVAGQPGQCSRPAQTAAGFPLQPVQHFRSKSVPGAADVVTALEAWSDAGHYNDDLACTHGTLCAANAALASISDLQHEQYGEIMDFSRRPPSTCFLGGEPSLPQRRQTSAHPWDHGTGEAQNADAASLQVRR